MNNILHCLFEIIFNVLLLPVIVLGFFIPIYMTGKIVKKVKLIIDKII